LVSDALLLDAVRQGWIRPPLSAGRKMPARKPVMKLREFAGRSSGSMIYPDSSVALAYLLAEDRYPSDALWDQSVVSASLLECEVWNRVNARRLQDSHGDALRGLIGRGAPLIHFRFQFAHWTLSI
jgi:hypothetical protein